MKVVEIKARLMELGIKKEDLKSLRKPALEKLLKEMDATSGEEGKEVTSTDPEWTDTIMKLFVDSELVDGSPTCNGLRRVCEKVIGKIVCTESYVEQTPDINNAYRATVKVIIHLANKEMYTGCADVHRGNAEQAFAAHPVATAETRAKARALRDALRLNIISSEELSKPEIDEPDGTDNRANSNIIGGIKMTCLQQNIDPDKLAKMLHGNDVVFENITDKQGQDIMHKLMSYIKKVESIPEEIKREHK